MQDTLSTVRPAIPLAARPAGQAIPQPCDPQADYIAKTFDFDFNGADDLAFTDAHGKPLQRAVRVTNRRKPSEQYVVIATGNPVEWFVVDPPQPNPPVTALVNAVQIALRLRRERRQASQAA